MYFLRFQPYYSFAVLCLSGLVFAGPGATLGAMVHRSQSKKKKKKKRCDATPSDAASAVPNPPAAPPDVVPLWLTILCFVVPPLLAVVAYRHASHVEFVGDTRFLIAENAFIRSLSYWSETLVHDYFWSSSGQIIPYWRPFTKLSWLLEWRWFQGWAGGCHRRQLLRCSPRCPRAVRLRPVGNRAVARPAAIRDQPGLVSARRLAAVHHFGHPRGSDRGSEERRRSPD